MKLLGILLAFASFVIAPAVADQWGGISGRVTDLQIGQPITHASILLYRSTDMLGAAPSSGSREPERRRRPVRNLIRS
jgi:hypothetical protein